MHLNFDSKSIILAVISSEHSNVVCEMCEIIVIFRLFLKKKKKKREIQHLFQESNQQKPKSRDGTLCGNFPSKWSTTGAETIGKTHAGGSLTPCYEVTADIGKNKRCQHIGLELT